VDQQEDREGKRKNKLSEKKLPEVEEIVCRGLFCKFGKN
jgi:hypothetical protein